MHSSYQQRLLSYVCVSLVPLLQVSEVKTKQNLDLG